MTVAAHSFDSSAQSRTRGSEDLGANLIEGAPALPEVPTVLWLGNLRQKSGELVALKIPLRLDVLRDPDSGWTIVQAPYVRSSGTGPTLADALDEISESILVLKVEVSVPDNGLASDALEMKRRIALILE